MSRGLQKRPQDISALGRGPELSAQPLKSRVSLAQALGLTPVALQFFHALLVLLHALLQLGLLHPPPPLLLLQALQFSFQLLDLYLSHSMLNLELLELMHSFSDSMSTGDKASWFSAS